MLLGFHSQRPRWWTRRLLLLRLLPVPPERRVGKEGRVASLRGTVPWLVSSPPFLAGPGRCFAGAAPKEERNPGLFPVPWGCGPVQPFMTTLAPFSSQPFDWRVVSLWEEQGRCKR